MSVLTQTLAIFIDAYRELNAKKLFWITLVLSLLLVIALALFGVSPTGVKFLHWEFPIPTPELYYKAVLLKYFVVDLWLTWAASVLALISTGGIFPDFLSGGAIDLYLCKPMSRPRLFLTKYVSGLMFVGLQVSFVSVGIFFVVGFRISDWRPSIFLAIPLVLCFFSYIYSVCVLLGVMTRSTVAAILLTVLVWIVFFSIRFFEPQILQFQYANERESRGTTTGSSGARPSSAGCMITLRRPSRLSPPNSIRPTWQNGACSGTAPPTRPGLANSGTMLSTSR